MSARLAAAWLEARLRAGVGDASEDLDDWLVGNDAAILDRAQARKTAMVLETGGEIG